MARKASAPRAVKKPPQRSVDFQPRNEKQRTAVDLIAHNHVVALVGAAGSGKTLIAIATALNALLSKEIESIIVTRPIVEAGESLGFLPGDVREKTDPYNAPVLDALRSYLGAQLLEAFIDDGKVRMVPLAFMRGRTFDDAWMILDEAQNATIDQTLMFMTRMGRNSKVILTGDESQCDLPARVQSGLKHALIKLENVDGFAALHFGEADVQRHPMVGSIIKAYARLHN